jgi:hypothetical protein
MTDPAESLGRAIGELIALPFQIIGWLFRLRRHWRQVPLHEKNRVRATCGAAGLVGCAALALTRFPVVGAKATGFIAAVALLYLVVGVKGSHGASYDVMSAIWYAAAAVGSLALLVYIRHNGLPLWSG